jgi:hypothetical protein
MRKRSASPIRPFDVVPTDVVEFAKRLSALLVPDAARRDHLGPHSFPNGEAAQVTTRAGPCMAPAHIPPVAGVDRTTTMLGGFPTWPPWATGGQ